MVNRNDSSRYMQGLAKEIYSCSYRKRHAGYDYYGSFINSVFHILPTVNLLLPTPA